MANAAAAAPGLTAPWKLQDATARFSEVVRRAQSEGPQRVTVHGEKTVVVVSAEEYATARCCGTRTGEELIKAMQQARKLGLKLKPARVPRGRQTAHGLTDQAELRSGGTHRMLRSESTR
jgi:prevent-host-death family protein